MHIGAMSAAFGAMSSRRKNASSPNRRRNRGLLHPCPLIDPAPPALPASPVSLFFLLSPPLLALAGHVSAAIFIHDLHAETYGTDEVSAIELPEARLHEVSRFVQGHPFAESVVEEAQREPRGEAVGAEGDALEGPQSVEPEKLGLTSGLIKWGRWERRTRKRKQKKRIIYLVWKSRYRTRSKAGYEQIRSDPT